MIRFSAPDNCHCIVRYLASIGLLIPVGTQPRHVSRALASILGLEKSLVVIN